MTDQHPLTDEIILSIADEAFHLPNYQDDLRAAADWQLEQVIEWLKSNLRSSLYLEPVGDDGVTVEVFYAIEDLRKAMRPQQQEDNVR